MIQTYVHYYYCYYCYYYSITHKNLVSVGHMFLKAKVKKFCPSESKRYSRYCHVN